MSDWIRKQHTIVHELKAQAGTVPDLQDSRKEKRMVIRPRQVTLHQTPGTNTVRWATVEGQQVRRDGELAGSKLVLCGYADWWLGVPPQWLTDLLTEYDLTWQANTASLVPAP